MPKPLCRIFRFTSFSAELFRALCSLPCSSLWSNPWPMDWGKGAPGSALVLGCEVPGVYWGKLGTTLWLAATAGACSWHLWLMYLWSISAWFAQSLGLPPWRLTPSAHRALADEDPFESLSYLQLLAPAIHPGTKTAGSSQPPPQQVVAGL